MSNPDIQQTPIVYIASDSIGETGEIVAKAAISQFDFSYVDIRRVPFLSSPQQVESMLTEAKELDGIVVYTLVNPELKSFLEQKAKKLNLLHVDIMGPLLNTLAAGTQRQPKHQPGVIRKIDKAYFSKIEAIEFAVKFDDGKDPRGVLQADVVLVGISRTSKTPLCMYLAHKGIKAANIPLVPDIAPPAELFSVSPQKVIGLTIAPSLLQEIRRERLKTMGLSTISDYAQADRIFYELEYAIGIMKKIGCPIIDVTNKAIEETAGKLLNYYRKGEL